MNLPFSLTTVALLILSCTAADLAKKPPRRVPRAVLCANPNSETYSLKHSLLSHLRMSLHLQTMHVSSSSARTVVNASKIPQRSTAFDANVPSATLAKCVKLHSSSHVCYVALLMSCRASISALTSF